MPRKNTVVPITSFDPRLKDVLLEGAKRRVELLCSSRKQRYALRNQLYDYRARAREQKLSDADQMYRAKITDNLPTREQNGATVWPLIIAPRGSEFDDVLGQAGLDTTQPSPQGEDLLADFKVEE